jgi:hypothetical protein
VRQDHSEKLWIPRELLHTTTRPSLQHRNHTATDTRNRINFHFTGALTMPQAQPELKKVSESHLYRQRVANLKKYLEKRILVQLNGSRKVMGVLRGYDVCIPNPRLLRSMLNRHRFT